MSYTVIKKMSPIEEIIREYPLTSTVRNQVIQNQLEVKSILENKAKRLLIIVGPCSAWPKESVLEYARRLLVLNERVKHRLKLVMRVYIQKPRTVKGWTGPLNQSDIFAQPDIDAGIRYTRDMMVKIVSMGLPIADEALFTHNAQGFIELLSWVAIGARSAEDQEHRIYASALDCAVGLKNPTHGSLAVAVNSVVSAQASHPGVFNGYEIMTHGNPYAHLVLRGSQHRPNYTITHLDEVKSYMEEHGINNPSIVIDASHDNCIINGEKEYLQQPSIVFDVLNNLQQRPDLRTLVKGFMIESFLKEGCQKIDSLKPDTVDLDGLSITDPCIGWERTEEFLLELASMELQ